MLYWTKYKVNVVACQCDMVECISQVRLVIDNYHFVRFSKF